jgi:hypothetical protein
MLSNSGLLPSELSLISLSSWIFFSSSSYFLYLRRVLLINGLLFPFSSSAMVITDFLRFLVIFEDLLEPGARIVSPPLGYTGRAWPS